MKIKKRNKKISLINYNLLKYQIYNIDNFKIVNTNLELKQALKIVYLYNVNKKKILFIGFPYSKSLNNQVNNFFISKNKWCSNTINVKMYDLIVFNCSKDQDEKILETLKVSNKPLIVFGKKTKKNYEVNGSFKARSIQKFCFFLLFSIIKKSI